ncbi:MAG: XdhC family protein, partial [Actinomycetota bacterium]
RARTRVDVAWIVDTHQVDARDRTDAVAITPGGGRIGSLLSGALDGQLTDLASRQSTHGRFVTLTVSDVDALIAGLPSGGEARCILIPASELPADLWPLLIAREPVCLLSRIENDVITETRLFTTATMAEAGDDAAQRFARGVSDAAVIGDTVLTVLWPVPKLVIVGAGANAEALRDAAALLGWQTVIATDANSATGVIAGLSSLDNVVVMIHDLEVAGAALVAALSSDAGYIGALGSHRMQETRAEWLAYRGHVDLERIHGPAGLNIGATTPAEIAVSILAEALGVREGLECAMKDCGGA